MTERQRRPHLVKMIPQDFSPLSETSDSKGGGRRKTEEGRLRRQRPSTDFPILLLLLLLPPSCVQKIANCYPPFLPRKSDADGEREKSRAKRQRKGRGEKKAADITKPRRCDIKEPHTYYYKDVCFFFLSSLSPGVPDSSSAALLHGLPHASISPTYLNSLHAAHAAQQAAAAAAAHAAQHAGAASASPAAASPSASASSLRTLHQAQTDLSAAAQRLGELHQATAAAGLVDPLALEAAASRRAGRKRHAAASPFSSDLHDLGTLLRYSPSASLSLLNGNAAAAVAVAAAATGGGSASPNSSGSYGHLSTGERIMLLLLLMLSFAHFEQLLPLPSSWSHLPRNNQSLSLRRSHLSLGLNALLPFPPSPFMPPLLYDPSFLAHLPYRFVLDWKREKESSS